jgi:hypothetical protein
MRIDQKQDTPAILSVPLWTAEVSFAQKYDKTLILTVVLYIMALMKQAWAITERDKASLLAVALKCYGTAVASRIE